jgi:hypothetical protein
VAIAECDDMTAPDPDCPLVVEFQRNQGPDQSS